MLLLRPGSRPREIAAPAVPSSQLAPCCALRGFTVTEASWSLRPEPAASPKPCCCVLRFVKAPVPSARLSLLEGDGKVGQLLQAFASRPVLREQVLSPEAVVA